MRMTVSKVSCAIALSGAVVLAKQKSTELVLPSVVAVIISMLQENVQKYPHLIYEYVVKPNIKDRLMLLMLHGNEIKDVNYMSKNSSILILNMMLPSYRSLPNSNIQQLLKFQNIVNLSKPPIKTNPTPDNPTQQSTAAIGAVSIIPIYIPAPIKATYVPPTIDIPINQDQSISIPDNKNHDQETKILAMMSPPSKSPSNTDPPQEPTTDISGNEHIPPDPVKPTSAMSCVDNEGNKESGDVDKVTLDKDDVAKLPKKEHNSDMNKPLLILSTLVAYSPNSPAKSAEMANPPKCEHIDKKPKLADTTPPQTTPNTPESTISGGNSMPSSPEMTDEVGVDGGRYEEVCLGDCNYFKNLNFGGNKRIHYHSSTKNPSAFFGQLQTIIDNKEQIKSCNFDGFDVALYDHLSILGKTESSSESILIFVDFENKQSLRYEIIENDKIRNVTIVGDIDMSTIQNGTLVPSTDPFPALAQARINEFLKQCLDHIKHLNSPLTNATEDLQQIKPPTCVDLEAEKATHDRVLNPS